MKIKTRNKLQYFYYPILGVILSLLIFIIYRYIRTTEVANTQSSQVESRITDIQNSISQYRLLTKLIAKSPSVQSSFIKLEKDEDFKNKQDLGVFFVELLQDNDEIKSIVLLDSLGNPIIGSQNDDNQYKILQPSDINLTYYSSLGEKTTSLSKNQTAISEIFIEKNTFPERPSAYILFASPIYDQYNLTYQGSAIIKISSQKLFSSLYSLPADSIYLIDERNYFIIHPDPRLSSTMFNMLEDAFPRKESYLPKLITKSKNLTQSLIENQKITTWRKFYYDPLSSQRYWIFLIQSPAWYAVF